MSQILTNAGTATISFLKSCYIVALTGSLAGKQIPFRSFPDGGIQDTKTANWNDIEIIGRSHPLLAYTSSAGRTLSFGLIFAADEQAQYYVRLSKALCYPEYKGTIKPPPLCRIKIGNFIDMYGVCDSAAPNHQLPLNLTSKVSDFIEITYSFKEAGEHPYSQSECLAGGAGVR